MTVEFEERTLEWSKAKPLQDYFLEKTKGDGGVYMWGFNNEEVDVVWYIGKSTRGKGVNTRLRDHYLNVMGGRYQIPYHFLDETFTEEISTGSGWKLEYKNSEIAKQLSDWEHMKGVYRAGHTFAHKAFARVIDGVPDDELVNVEQQAILKLRPAINKQRSRPVSQRKYRFKESAGDTNWIQAWLDFQSNRHGS